MSDEFKLGDLVRLKSGGPLMTVDYLVEGDGVGCVWFMQDEVDSKVFIAASLTKENEQRNRRVVDEIVEKTRMGMEPQPRGGMF